MGIFFMGIFGLAGLRGLGRRRRRSFGFARNGLVFCFSNAPLIGLGVAAPAVSGRFHRTRSGIRR